MESRHSPDDSVLVLIFSALFAPLQGSRDGRVAGQPLQLKDASDVEWPGCVGAGFGTPEARLPSYRLSLVGIAAMRIGVH